MNSDSLEDSVPAKHSADGKSNHPDPITGEAGAHPIGVGVGAMGAGLAGAAIGAIAGPIGVLVGAAIGAVAGGLAGKEVAAAEDEPVSLADEPVETESSPEQDLPTDPSSMSATAATEETAEKFHEAFTTTTWQEAVAEDKLLGGSTQACFASEEFPAGAAAASQEPIRTAAYFRYLDRNASGESGDELADWIRAERAAGK